MLVTVLITLLGFLIIFALESAICWLMREAYKSKDWGFFALTVAFAAVIPFLLLLAVTEGP